MLRFILERHEMHFGPGIDRRGHYTLDIDVPELQAVLSSGGSGEDGFESHRLLGVEIIPDGSKQ